jgi:hypothetical protein
VSRRPTLAPLLTALALAGCDGSDDEAQPEPEPQPPPKETVHHVPKLPDGWRPYINRAGGFGLGLPRGWKASDRRSDALIRSFDRLVAVSIVPDRGDEALEVPVEDFATRAAAALPGFEQAVRPSRTHQFEHRYGGAQVRAEATAKQSGVEQTLRVIVLRRGGLATFTIVIASNSKPAAEPSEQLAGRVVETLRSRPPSGGGRQRSGRSG